MEKVLSGKEAEKEMENLLELMRHINKGWEILSEFAAETEKVVEELSEGENGDEK